MPIVAWRLEYVLVLDQQQKTNPPPTINSYHQSAVEQGTEPPIVWGSCTVANKEKVIIALS